MSGPALAGVAAFAVAFALLVASNPQTAEAATVPATGTAAHGTGELTGVEPGDVVRITGPDASTFVQFAIDDGSTATGSFAANGSQSLGCSDRTTGSRGSGCDYEDGAGIEVRINVDDDSPNGFIIVNREAILGGEDDTVVITVKQEARPAALKLERDDAAIQATHSATAETSVITATVTSDESPPKKMNGETVTFVTTAGLLLCPPKEGSDELGTADRDPTQYCQVNTRGTAADGTTPLGRAQVRLQGAGVAGAATVTATRGTLSKSVSVTLFGTAKNLAVEAEESTIEVGGSTYVVLTITDAAGNPVSGAKIDPITPTSKEVVGPGDNPNPVVTTRATPARTGTDDGAGLGYSKDKPGAKAVRIPACGEDNTDIDADESGLQELFAKEGTDDNGRCVVHVTASDEDPKATRGEHVLNFEYGTGTNKLTATVTVDVAGTPSTIDSDAPERIDPSDEVTVNVTVLDDEGVRVGAVPIEVIQLSRGGLIIDPPKAETTDGRATFTYLASSTAGIAEFLVRTRAELNDDGKPSGKTTAKQPIIIAIAEEAPPEPPEPPTPEVSVSGESGLVIIKNANSIEDILAELACGSTTGTTITLPGNNIYAVGAPAVANRGFLANVSFPIEEAAAYVACGG